MDTQLRADLSTSERVFLSPNAAVASQTYDLREELVKIKQNIATEDQHRRNRDR
jgi:hypothetical protein